MDQTHWICTRNGSTQIIQFQSIALPRKHNGDIFIVKIELKTTKLEIIIYNNYSTTLKGKVIQNGTKSWADTIRVAEAARTVNLADTNNNNKFFMSPFLQKILTVYNAIST